MGLLRKRVHGINKDAIEAVVWISNYLQFMYFKRTQQLSDFCCCKGNRTNRWIIAD